MLSFTFAPERRTKGRRVQTGMLAIIELNPNNMEEVMNQNQGAAFVLLPKSVVDEIKDNQRLILSLIRGKAKEEVLQGWHESEEARKILGVSQKTWQTYRDTRVLPFSQFGRKIYVKHADLEAFLQDHIIRG